MKYAVIGLMKWGWRLGLEKMIIFISVWEKQINDRTQTLGALNGILDEKIDLITIQVGENVDNYEIFRIIPNVRI